MARKLLKGIEEAQMDMINHIKVQLSRQNVTQEPRTQPKEDFKDKLSVDLTSDNELFAFTS